MKKLIITTVFFLIGGLIYAKNRTADLCKSAEKEIFKKLEFCKLHS